MAENFVASVQRGFTLLEALIAMAIGNGAVIATITLLLQALAAHSVALHREQAGNLLADLADDMLANPSARAAYVSGGYAGGPRLQLCASAGNCDAALLAEHQLAEWQIAIAASLPESNGAAASGSVSADAAAAPGALQLEIQWGAAGQSAPERAAMVVSAGVGASP